jgi:hypothetical protein
MDQNSANSTDWLDGTAVALSALCLVHCLALPLIIAGVPFFAAFDEGHLHAQMLIVVLPLSIFALSVGFQRHHSMRVVATGAAGMLLLTIGGTIAHDQYGLWADRLLSISGALTLATAHFYNSVLSRRCRISASDILPD